MPSEAGTGPQVAIAVAALDLAGVGDVVWDIEVVDGASTPGVVWSKRVSSSRYGDGGGSASVVGPCDADPAVSRNTVRVWVVGVYAAAVSDPGAFASGASDGVGAVVGAPLPFENPTTSGPLTREVDCVANADAHVAFDVALMRPASQGFFDIAVSFNDVFCSAKLDCCAGPVGATCALDGSEDIQLLFDASGQRASTLVLGFACTAGVGATRETNLYLDALALDCTSPSDATFAADVLLDPSGPPGNQCTAGADGMSACVGAVTEVDPAAVDADDVLFQVAAYRGVELLESGGEAAQKVYWNVALGVKRPAIASCWLRTRATADDADAPTVVDGVVAAGAVYPYVQWDVDLGACGAEALSFGDPGAAVRPAYTATGDAEPTTFGYGFGPSLPAGPLCTTCGGPVTSEYTALSAGGMGTGSTAHGTTCAVRADGTLWCWGFNNNGQVGDGTTTTRIAPTQVGVDADWGAVAVGGLHSCAIKQDGTAWCWGDNLRGQLGDGTTVDRGAPVQVGSDADWAALSAGDSTTCGLRTDQSVWCWGLGTSGQLGDGLLTNSSVPVQVAGGASWAALSVGAAHVCALRTDGTAWCWGSNGNNRLGSGLVGNQGTPVAVSAVGTESWASITAGGTHSCGVQSDGSLWCWGDNGLGQLGIGTLTAAPLPTLVDAGPASWSTVGAGAAHTCALTDAGVRWCWGASTYSEIGERVSIQYRTVPIEATGGGTWTGLTVGSQHNCAVRADDTIWCWGRNHEGQLGFGGELRWASPVQHAGTWSEVAKGHGGFGCARRDDGDLWCWGPNSNGQLGNGRLGEGFGVLPEPVVIPWAEADRWQAAPRRMGSEHSCALRADGTAWCWGSSLYEQLGDGGVLNNTGTPTAVAGGMVWSTLAVGGRHTCAIRSDQTLWCWGLGTSGQLGYGSTANQSSPVQAGTDADWADADAGYAHTCGLRTDQTLWCWGENNNLQIGDGSATDRRDPVPIGAGSLWRAVAAGYLTTCAIRTDGTLWCWGYNGEGQLGDGTTTNRSTPAQVGTDTSWVAVSAARYHTCGLQSDGSLWCWGSNARGQLGDGTFSTHTTPSPSGSGHTWASVSTGFQETCALTTDGALYCWGNDTAGQTTGYGGDERPYPLPVP
ncbi:MAG: hypothetical protein EP329_20615 [Deltaproteobacteria bacterium]|nr:MAG: hypothetical protein EP329_20615 [Deltaproteobacteria bacterium]